MIGIYKITNIINNDCYIGQSINIEQRWRDHLSICNNKKSKSYDYYLYRSMRKYGVDNFHFEVLEECNIETLTEREQYYYILYEANYNMIEPKENPVHNTDVMEYFVERCQIGWKNRSEESKNKALINLKLGANSNKSNKYKTRPIKAVNTVTNEKFYFDSLYEASKTLAIPRASIHQILDSEHVRKTSKKFTFQYISN